MALTYRVLTGKDDIEGIYDHMVKTFRPEWNFCQGWTVETLFDARLMRFMVEEDPPAHEIPVCLDGDVLIALAIIWRHSGEQIRVWFNGEYLNGGQDRYAAMATGNTAFLLERYGQQKAKVEPETLNTDLVVKWQEAFPRNDRVAVDGEMTVLTFDSEP